MSNPVLSISLSIRSFMLISSLMIVGVYGFEKEIYCGYTQLITGNQSQGFNVGFAMEKNIAKSTGIGFRLNYMNLFSKIDYLNSYQIDGLFIGSKNIGNAFIKLGAGIGYHRISNEMEWHDEENRFLGTYRPGYVEPVLSINIGYGFFEEKRNFLPKLSLEYKTGTLPNIYNENKTIPDKNNYKFDKLSLNLVWVL
ncbi:MAG: hypothetical protein V1913_03700 [Fibrobacterota bacterium]